MWVGVEPAERSLWLAVLHVLVGWWWGSPWLLWAGIYMGLVWGRALWRGVGGIDIIVGISMFSRS